MASWGGHTLPGTFFILFGIYYLISHISRYLKHRSKKDFNYYATFKCCGIPFSVHVIEGCVKIFFISCGTLVELFYPGAPQGALHRADGNFTHPMNWQHATMYLFFGLSGWFDIVSYMARDVVPRGLDRMAAGLALFVEGYLFYFHLDGRSIIDSRCHVLLVLAVWPCALFVFLEVFFTKNRMVTHVLQMLYTILLIFQGVWFWMVAYILYPPDHKTWDPCYTEGMPGHDNENTCSGDKEQLSHLNLMFLTMFWTWALAIVIMVVMIIYFLLYRFFKMRRTLDPSFHKSWRDEMMSLTAPNKQNGMAGKLLGHVDDEDEL